MRAMRSFLVTCLLVTPGLAQDSITVEGSWWSSFGPMVLSQDGDRVQGSYGFDERALEGELDGQELRLAYGDGGEVVFQLWPDGEHMSGPWTSGERSGRWGAYRQQPRQAEPRPGEITTGQSESGLRYHLRVPEDYDPDRSYTAVVILHGSNMSARDYVATFPAAWPGLAERYLILGFDGEQMNGFARVGSPSYNYSYVNFGGPGVGPPFAHRQSPALVAQALQQLQGELPVERWILGGHSQGGFLTYALAMFYPELLAGVFPMSCNLLVQCEPSSFDDRELRARQRRLAFAPIHGIGDPVVPFSGGEYCYGALVDGGFPLSRFFTHERAGHMFALLPVEEAITWIDRLTAERPEDVLSVAERGLEANRWRDVGAALWAGRELGFDAGQRERMDRARAALQRAAAVPLGELEPKLMANRDGSWVDEFLAFREDFAFAPAAAEVMAAYAALRRVHQGPADELFRKQRQTTDETERDRLRRAIVEDYYASSWYPLVKDWLSE